MLSLMGWLNRSASFQKASPRSVAFQCEGKSSVLFVSIPAVRCAHQVLVSRVIQGQMSLGMESDQIDGTIQGRLEVRFVVLASWGRRTESKTAPDLDQCSCEARYGW